MDVKESFFNDLIAVSIAFWWNLCQTLGVFLSLVSEQNIVYVCCACVVCCGLNALWRCRVVVFVCSVVCARQVMGL